MNLACVSRWNSYRRTFAALQPAISNLILYGAEFRAWQTTILNAVAAKVKILTLPGGFAIYSQSWSNSDLGKNAYDGISGFLANWANITNPPKP